MAKASGKSSKVGSSNVADYRYDREKQIMEIDFLRKASAGKKAGKAIKRKGGNGNASYRYFDVPPDEFRGLKRAKSKGRYVNGMAYDYDYVRLR